MSVQSAAKYAVNAFHIISNLLRNVNACLSAIISKYMLFGV